MLWMYKIAMDNNSAPRCSSSIPKRYVICSFVFVALGINYLHRFAIGLLITEMVARPHSDSVSHGVYCSRKDIPDNNTSRITNRHKGEFNWDEYTQGIILSSFFWGFLLTQIPGGMLSERVGGKYTLALSILASALGSLLIPVVARETGAWGVVLVRIMMGLGQGFESSSINELLSKWVPTKERGKLASVVFAGAYVGNVVSMLVSGLVLGWTGGNWAVVFYLYGGAGLVWLLFWQWLGYSRPGDHPGLSPSERQYLEEYSTTVNLKKSLPPTPWVDILTSFPVWAAVIGMFGRSWGLYSTLTELSKYMVSVLDFSVTQAGLWSALMYVFMCIGAWVSAMVIHVLLTRNIVSTTVNRKIFATIDIFLHKCFCFMLEALTGCAVAILCASYSGCDKPFFIAFMVLAMGMLGSECAGVKLNSLDLSPNYAGSVMGLITFGATLGGMIPPYIVGLVLHNIKRCHHDPYDCFMNSFRIFFESGNLVFENTIHEWRYVFLMTGAVMVGTNAFFIFAASGEIQPWNDPSSS